jgi:hypothetical protein
MKKASLLILFFSFCFSAFCQELTPDKADFNLSYSASIGENFLANRMGAGYGQWLNDKVGVRFGIASTDFAFKCPFEKVEDKAPYSAKGKQISLNAALDYKASDKLLLSFSAYFSTMNAFFINGNVGNMDMYYTRAFNASMRYMFNEKSFIDISLTLVDSNNPFLYCNPYLPYYSRYNSLGFNEFTSFWLP